MMNEMEELEKMMLKLKSENSDKSKAIGDLKEQNLLLKKKYDMMSRNIAEATKTYGKISDEISGVVGEKANTISIEMDHLKSKFDNYDDSLEGYNHRVSALGKDLEKHLEYLKTLKEQVKSLEKQNEAVRESIINTQGLIPLKTITKLSERASQTDIHLKKIETKLFRMEKTFDDKKFERDLGEEIELSFDKIDSLKEAHKELKESLSHIVKNVEFQSKEQKATLERLTRNSHDFEQQIQEKLHKELEKNFSSASKRLDIGLKEQKTELGNFGKNFYDLNSKVEEQLEDSKTEVASFKEKAVSEIKEAKSRLYAGIDKEILPIKKSLSSTKDNIQELENQLKDMTKVTVKLADKTGLEFERIAKKLEALDKLEELKKNYNSQIKIIQEDINRLKEGLVSAEYSLSKFSQYSVGMKTFQAELKELKNQQKTFSTEIENWRLKITKTFIDNKREINQQLKEISDSRKELAYDSENFKSQILKNLAESETKLLSSFNTFVRNMEDTQRRNEEKISLLLGQLLKEKIAFRADIEKLENGLRKFSTFEKDVKKDILEDARSIFKNLTKDFERNEKKIFLMEKNFEFLFSKIQTLSSKIEGLSKDVNLTKERYDIELGLLLKEIEK